MRAREFTINIPINIKINGDGEPEVTAANDEQEDGDLGKFVPPLQQKIELLKKSNGIDNVFDQEASDDEPFE